MGQITEQIKKVNQEGRVALISYLTGCYPDKEKFRSVLMEVDKYSDIIEIGLPFSDPLADGPVIQKTSKIVLDAGVATDDILNEINAMKHQIKSSLVVMTYFNIAYRYGFDGFAKRLSEVGVSGVILPDLPPEESSEWLNSLKKYNLDSIFLIAPTSSGERIKLAADISTGFIYCVSVAGVTGAREELPDTLPDLVKSVKAVSDKPVAVGFGISKPSQVRELSMIAEGVIIGSALLKQINPDADAQQIIQCIKDFLEPIYQATKR